MLRNKSIKIFLNYFLGPVLFVALSFSIFQQIKAQPHLAQSWQQIKASFASLRVLYLLAATLLIFVNWGIEALKWKLLVGQLQSINFLTAYKAVLSGVSVSLALPNRVGEYLGRMVYQPEGGRLKTVSLSVVGGMAQLLATMVFGAVGLLALKDQLLHAFPQLVIGFQFIFYGLLLVVACSTFFFYNVSTVVRFFKRWLSSHHYLYLVEALQNFNAAFLSKILFLSSLRYAVFMLQYIILFYFFGVNVSVAVMLGVMSVVFLALAVIPSIALLEVGLRGEISLQLMGLYSANTLGIGFTSVTVWMLNLIIPAIIGTLFLLNVKLLSKNDDE